MSLTTGELTSRLVGFLAFALLARRLHPDQYGAVEFAVALAGFFAMIVDFGLEAIGARAIARDKSEAARLAAQIPAARLLVALVAVPAIILVATVAGQPKSTVYLAGLYGLALFALPWFQRWLFQGLEMMDWISLGQVIRSAVFCFGVFVLVRGPEHLLTAGLVEIASAFAATGFYLWVQKHKNIARPGFDFSPTAILGLFRNSAWVGLSQIVWASNQYLPTLLVAAISTASELSWLGASQRIVFSVIAFSFVYHFNLFPTVSRYLEESRSALDALIGASFRSVSWLGIMGALAGSLYAGLISRLVFGEAFAAAATPFAILVWAIPITLLSGHARNTLVAGGEQRFVFAAQLSGVATTVAAGIALIPPLGATGGAIAIVISYLAVWATAHFFAVRRVAPMPLFGVVRPLMLAGAVYVLREYFAPGGFLSGLAALAAYVAAGPLLDRGFISDIRKIIAVRRAGSVAST